MSLMGGTLIVISSGDHQSNNTSDQYQQTFYVAEHALLEAEKQIFLRGMEERTHHSLILCLLKLQNYLPRIQMAE